MQNTTNYGAPESYSKMDSNTPSEDTNVTINDKFNMKIALLGRNCGRDRLFCV